MWALTPQGHEDGEEDGGRVVEQVAGAGRATGRHQLPVAAGVVAQRAHGDVVPRIADLHAGKRRDEWAAWIIQKGVGKTEFSFTSHVSV